MATVFSVGELRDKLTEALNRAAHGKERIIVSSGGRPKAAIIGIDDLNRLEGMEGASLHKIDPTESEAFQTMLATEDILRKDWDTPDEDETWAHL